MSQSRVSPKNLSRAQPCSGGMLLKNILFADTHASLANAIYLQLFAVVAFFVLMSQTRRFVDSVL